MKFTHEKIVNCLIKDHSKAIRIYNENEDNLFVCGNLLTYFTVRGDILVRKEDGKAERF